MKADPVVGSGDNRIATPLSLVERVLRHSATAWIVFGLMLLLTVLAWWVLDRLVTERARDRFTFETDTIHTAILERLNKQVRVLAGGAGLYAASVSVERLGWRDYVRTLDLPQNYPGMQGLGYAHMIRPQELAAHEQMVRREGFPGYAVWPPGQRERYSSIVFLEPFAGRNLRAFGYDMYSEPARRAAMDRATDLADVALTERVTLVQETEQDPQYGFLMYMPVYRKGSPLRSQEQRRQALQGFVFSPFRMNDLMAGVVPSEMLNIDFDIHDGDSPASRKRMYSSAAGLPDSAPAQAGEFERQTNMLLGGRIWQLHFYSRPGYMLFADRIQPVVMATSGVLIDVLVFLILTSYAGQRRRAEALALGMTEQVRASAAREHAIVNNVADGILTIRPDGTIESCNAPAGRIFGIRSTRLVGRSVLQYLHGPHHSQLQATLANPDALRSVSTGLALVVEGTRKNGEVFPMELTLSQAELGHQRLIIAIVRDITERRKVERMKDEFISTVSHELRTPLTSIRGSLSLLAAGHAGSLPKPAGELVTVAHRNTERLLYLINDILDFEKLNSEHLNVVTQPRNLAVLLQQAIQSMNSYATEFKVQIRLVSCPDEATVRVDDNRFQQVMANLLSNAVKYSPGGGRVEVKADFLGERWRISVRDQGAGIPEQFQDRIFEKFFQADSSDTRARGGTGLGLHISKAIVERMGGTIGFDSVPGQGACFWFDMPALTGTGIPVETGMQSTQHIH